MAVRAGVAYSPAGQAARYSLYAAWVWSVFAEVKARLSRPFHHRAAPPPRRRMTKTMTKPCSLGRLTPRYLSSTSYTLP